MCGIEANNPHMSTGSPIFIVAKAKYFCAGPARQVDVEINIEQKLGASWTQVSHQSHRQYSMVPDKTYVLQTDMTCRPGRFRALARIVDAVDSAGFRMEGRNVDFVTSQEVQDPCR